MAVYTFRGQSKALLKRKAAQDTTGALLPSISEFFPQDYITGFIVYSLPRMLQNRNANNLTLAEDNGSTMKKAMGITVKLRLQWLVGMFEVKVIPPQTLTSKQG